jgi:hypothetical protein
VVGRKRGDAVVDGNQGETDFNLRRRLTRERGLRPINLFVEGLLLITGRKGKVTVRTENFIIQKNSYLK